MRSIEEVAGFLWIVYRQHHYWSLRGVKGMCVCVCVCGCMCMCTLYIWEVYARPFFYGDGGCDGGCDGCLMDVQWMDKY